MAIATICHDMEKTSVSGAASLQEELVVMQPIRLVAFAQRLASLSFGRWGLDSSACGTTLFAGELV